MPHLTNMTTQQAGDIYSEPFQPISQRQILKLLHLVSNMTAGSGI